MDISGSARARFEETFGGSPSVVVRAPGRVNLIGEHTDYAHLPVLPMAIDRALWIAAAPTATPVLRARSNTFPDVIEVDRHEPRHRGGWGAYLAGVLGMLETVAPGRGANVAIAGDLPSSGGLSSSSAFSVGVMIALLNAWGETNDPAAVALQAAEAERSVGVETGGMDQLAIALAREGSALRIDFEPLAWRHVPLPDGLHFVVASSGDDAPKGGAARDAYNERVMGMRLATALLCERIGVDPVFPLRLGDIAAIDVVDIIAEELPPMSSVQEASKLTGVPIGKLGRFSSGSWDINRKTPVRPVAMHILAEAARVEAAEQALAIADLSRFGGLLNESQYSLRDNMRCSTPALDALCKAMRRAGAFGARLTGAGFGGFALAACDGDHVLPVLEAARSATGGTEAFEVVASDGVQVL
jgi:galactokinase